MIPRIIALARPRRFAISRHGVDFNDTPIRIDNATIPIINRHAATNTHTAEYSNCDPIFELVNILPGPQTTAATIIAGPDFTRSGLLVDLPMVWLRRSIVAR